MTENILARNLADNRLTDFLFILIVLCTDLSRSRTTKSFFDYLTRQRNE